MCFYVLSWFKGISEKWMGNRKWKMLLYTSQQKFSNRICENTKVPTFLLCQMNWTRAKCERSRFLLNLINISITVCLLITGYVYIITRFPSAYGLYSRVKSFSNEGAERLSERNALTSEYNPYKRGTRVIKCLLCTPKWFAKSSNRQGRKSS